MQKANSLKEIEIQTFRLIVLNDGLLDIYLGLVLVSYALWIYTSWPGTGWLNGGIVGLFFPLLMLLKIRLVQPRVGLIKPGPARRKRIYLLVGLIFLGVIVTVAMVLATALASEQVSQIFAGIPLILWALGGSILIAALAVSWLINWPRLIIYGFLSAIALPLDAVYILHSGKPPLTLIPILVMVGTGLYLLAVFLKNNPPPVMGELE